MLEGLPFNAGLSKDTQIHTLKHVLLLTCGEEFECVFVQRPPALPQRCSSLTNGAQDDKAGKKSIQETPFWCHRTNHEGREEEEEEEDEHREDAGVDEGSTAVG